MAVWTTASVPEDKASFSFKVDLNQDLTVDGRLSFRHKRRGMLLKSKKIDWYTLNDNKVVFQGTGSINDKGLYTFRVQATDGDLIGSSADVFDISIWNGTETIVAPFYLAKNNLDNGAIVIHQ